MKSFTIIWLGELISMLGSGLTSFALGVWIFQRTGNATPFALTVLFSSLPRVLLSPIAGSLVDRWNRRWVMILADTGSALVTLSVLVVFNLGDLQIWMIYIIATMGSVFAAFQEPAFTTSITMLVPKNQLARASGLNQLSQALEMLLTPVLAGILFVQIGFHGIVLIDFITYFCAIAALFIVVIPQPVLSTSDTGKKWAVTDDFRFGWNYLRVRNGLLGLLFYFALVNFLLNLSAVLMGPLVLSRYNADTYGYIQLGSGLGMLFGSMLMSAWGGPKGNKIPSIIGFIALAAVGLGLTGLTPSAVVIGSGLFVMMFAIPFGSSFSQAVFQTKVAPEAQGRVFAIRTMISRSMMPAAFLIAGPLADRIFEPLMQAEGGLSPFFSKTIIGTGPGRGVGLIFIASGLLLFFVSLLVYLNPRIRLLEDEIPDAIPEVPVVPFVPDSAGAVYTETEDI